jgi:hypothetical protein
MLASVGVAARDPFPSGGILTRPFVTHIFNLTVVIQVHTVGNMDRHPITRQLASDVLEGWKAWAAEHAKALQRASSAVEGRNGALAQLQHHQRGLPQQRDKVWTVLPNFDCRAPDGTTPAARFFRRGCPALFETVLSTIDDLPRPRKRNQAMTLSG